jgi:serpin B
MNKDLLIDAMGLIPDDVLQEAEEYQGDLDRAINENEVKKRSGIIGFITGHRGPIVIAASIAIFVLACVAFVSLNQRNRYDRTTTMENISTPDTAITELPDSFEYKVGESNGSAASSDELGIDVDVSSSAQEDGWIVKDSPTAQETVYVTNLMAGVEAQKVTVSSQPEEYGPVMTDFAVRLFKNGYKNGENQLISPLSVISALGMAANGAQNETLKEMEDVLGVKHETLNHYLKAFVSNKYKTWENKFTIANSIWFDEGRIGKGTVQKDFLQTNADYYEADLYELKFNRDAKDRINEWVSEKTDGKIPKMLEDNISDETVMFLVNALSFDADWESPYSETAVHEEKFITENGSERKAEFMYSRENAYIEDENTTGFVKYYNGRRYAFVALLPNEGIKMSDYVSSLDGQKIENLLKNIDESPVNTKTPKFNVDYSIELKDTLETMGMKLAFDQYKADFYGIAHPTPYPLYIGRVLHKTFFRIDEKGTSAGAATMIDVRLGGILDIETKEPYTVYLDRPFVYMLIDCKSNTPFFIGTAMDIGE